MSTEQMRSELIKAYNNASPWRSKVKAMPDDQVVAVYRRLKSKGQIK